MVNLVGKDNKNNTFNLESTKGINYSQSKILIYSKKIKINIQEEKGLCEIFYRETKKKEKIENFNITLQSDLTHRVIKKIINKNDCNLIKLNKSIKIHKVLLDSLLSHYNKVTKKLNKRCPIT